MKDNRLHYPIKLMASALDVSRSGYYAWLDRNPSARAKADEELAEKILEVHEESRKTYGPKRIKSELAEQGVHAGRDHIARIRKEKGLICIQRRKFKATTNSKHNLPMSPISSIRTSRTSNQEKYGVLISPTFPPAKAGSISQG